jgi:hypothetical protein
MSPRTWCCCTLHCSGRAPYAGENLWSSVVHHSHHRVTIGSVVWHRCGVWKGMDDHGRLESMVFQRLGQLCGDMSPETWPNIGKYEQPMQLRIMISLHGHSDMGPWPSRSQRYGAVAFTVTAIWGRGLHGHSGMGPWPSRSQWYGAVAFTGSWHDRSCLASHNQTVAVLLCVQGIVTSMHQNAHSAHTQHGNDPEYYRCARAATHACLGQPT